MNADQVPDEALRRAWRRRRHDVTDREIAILARLSLAGDKVDVAVTAFRAGEQSERDRRGY